MNGAQKLKICKFAVLAVWVASLITSYRHFFWLGTHGGNVTALHWLHFAVFFISFLAVASFCMGKIGYVLLQIAFAIPIITLVLIHITNGDLTDTVAGLYLAGLYLGIILPFAPVFRMFDFLNDESGLVLIILVLAIDLIISLVYFLKPIKEKYIASLIEKADIKYK